MKVRITDKYPVKKMRGVEMDFDMEYGSEDKYVIDSFTGLMFLKDVIYKTPQWFEKLEEDKQKPKYRIGDYVVSDSENINDFIFLKIYSIEKLVHGYLYNESYVESELREATPEELSRFYR